MFSLWLVKCSSLAHGNGPVTFLVVNCSSAFTPLKGGPQSTMENGNSPGIRSLVVHLIIQESLPEETI